MPDLDAQQLRAILKDATAQHTDAGFNVAVLVGDQLHQVSAGVANPELSTPMTEDTLAQIGSTTKLLNAALIVRLAELKVLDLDKPVADVIPGFRMSDALATRVVTLRHCLTMTSGMDGGPYDDFGSDDDCLAKYVARLGDVLQLFPPGAGFGYSNAGIVVAGHAAECATGKRWDDLFREHILEPAGMDHTETLTDRLLFHRVAVGIGPEGKVQRPWYMTRSAGPAGSTCASTAADLVKFARLFLSGGQSAEGRQVLSSESVGEMTRPVVEVATGFPAEHWCMGPGWTDTGTHVILGHPGFNASGCAVLWWVPGLGLAIAGVTNAPPAFGALVDCARQIMSRLGCRPPADPEPAPDERVENADELTGLYESALIRYRVTVSNGDLLLNAQGQGMLLGQMDATTRLVPAGRHGFIPEHPLLPGISTPTAVAFRDYAGVRILLNGNGAARFVESPEESTTLQAEAAQL